MDFFGDIHSMSYYAKVRDGIVVNVIRADESFFQTFVDDSPGEWLQTSYNTRGGIHYLPDSDTPSPDQSKALRKNYAGIGYTYDFSRDAFIPPKPYPSWVLDDFSCTWIPPVPYPDDGNRYIWDESTQSWVLYTQETT
jgi:hypothetical protein